MRKPVADELLSHFHDRCLAIELARHSVNLLLWNRWEFKHIAQIGLHFLEKKFVVLGEAFSYCFFHANTHQVTLII